MKKQTIIVICLIIFIAGTFSGVFGKEAESFGEPIAGLAFFVGLAVGIAALVGRIRERK